MHFRQDNVCIKETISYIYSIVISDQIIPDFNTSYILHEI